MDVLISGASVAGPALAYWLNRHGIRATIVERAEKIRPGGLAVDFRGTAMRVLDQMGILDELRAHATHSGDARVVDADGNQIAIMPGEIFAGELEVLKTDLTRILYDLTKNDTEYVFGDSIATLTQDADGVRVGFERGATRTFDLVIGADGLHSRVRALAFGPKERFTQHMGYAFASFSTDNYLSLDRMGMSHVSGDRSLNVFASKENTELRVLFMFPAQDVPRNREAQEEAIRTAYENVGWEAQSLLARMPAATDFYFDELSQITMPSWSTGRVTLVGDAGYCASPMSGRGTSQALLGAYVLAGELSTQDSHEKALAEYEHALRDYVAAAHELGRQARDSFTIPVSQELFDAFAAADMGEHSPDEVALKNYAARVH
ncbi:FAD-dependent monooxygenase [Actinophytocola sp.]|uniref:FAD-dependent monooxygenase n=1 Tax=Actinophytocola sp. TaxID=1872138 RepID=UPI00389A2FCF